MGSDVFVYVNLDLIICIIRVKFVIILYFWKWMYIKYWMIKLYGIFFLIKVVCEGICKW